MNPRLCTAQPERTLSLSKGKSKAILRTLRLRRSRGYAQSERETQAGYTRMKTAIEATSRLEVHAHEDPRITAMLFPPS